VNEQKHPARAAATESLIWNLVSIGTVVGLSLLLARRDWIARQAMAVRAAWARGDRRHWIEREVAEFRRRVSEWEHGQGESC